MTINNIIAKQSELQCRLKWAHSTIFLTTNTTASCHRCDHNPITEDFDFHNTHQKVHARLQMLRNEWPELGCEHCRVIEQAGGMSDRLLHDSTYFAPESPPELYENPEAVYVTPTKLEIYFSNFCQMACTYCGSHFSSTWEAEDKKYGHIDHFMYEKTGKKTAQYQELKYLDKVFEWLEENGQHLRELFILGGEPFIQPQTDRLLDLLENSGDKFSNLSLYFTSNLTSDKSPKKIDRISNLLSAGKIQEGSVIGSIDCWGKEAEYVRYGLNCDTFDRNVKYIANHDSEMNCNINICWSPISTFTMPDLIEKYKEWNELFVKNKKISGMNMSMMQAGGKEWMHPSIFGPQILDWGYNDAISMLEDLNIPGLENVTTKHAVEYFKGIKKSIEKSSPNKKAQQDLHKYLTELDRRRGTDYRQLFPILYDAIHSD